MTIGLKYASLSPTEYEKFQKTTDFNQAYRYLTQMQLLILATFAFILLKRFALYPAEQPGTILDTDWFYRKAGYGLVQWSGTVWGKMGPATSSLFARFSERAYKRLESAFSPRGEIARGGLSGGATVWTAVILAAVLLLSFLSS